MRSQPELIGYRLDAYRRKGQFVFVAQQLDHMSSNDLVFRLLSLLDHRTDLLQLGFTSRNLQLSGFHSQVELFANRCFNLRLQIGPFHWWVWGYEPEV